MCVLVDLLLCLQVPRESTESFIEHLLLVSGRELHIYKSMQASASLTNIAGDVAATERGVDDDLGDDDDDNGRVNSVVPPRAGSDAMALVAEAIALLQHLAREVHACCAFVCVCVCHADVYLCVLV
jgi:hypothetical protein